MKRIFKGNEESEFKNLSPSLLGFERRGGVHDVYSYHVNMTFYVYTVHAYTSVKMDWTIKTSMAQHFAQPIGEQQISTNGKNKQQMSSKNIGKSDEKYGQLQPPSRKMFPPGSCSCPWATVRPRPGRSAASVARWQPGARRTPLGQRPSWNRFMGPKK